MPNWQLIEYGEGRVEWGLEVTCSGLGEHSSFQLSVKAGLLQVFSPASRWQGDRLLLLNELMAQAVSSWVACGGFQGKVNTVVSSSWLPVITQARERE